MLVETTRVNEFEYYLACTHKGRSPIICHESWQNVKSIHRFDSRAAWLTRTGLCAAWHNHNLDALNCCSSSRKLPVNISYTETRFSDQERSSEFINYAAANSLAIQQLNTTGLTHCCSWAETIPTVPGNDLSQSYDRLHRPRHSVPVSPCPGVPHPTTTNTCIYLINNNIT